MTSLLMKPTSAGKDTRHKRDQPLKKLAYVSNHWGPLLRHEKPQTNQALFVIHRTAEVTMLQTNSQQVTNGEIQHMTELLPRETQR